MNRFNLLANFFLVAVFCCFVSCNNNAEIDSKEALRDKLLEDSTSVFIFLNIECPICQKYQGDLKKYTKYNTYFVFPNDTNKLKIKEFLLYDSIKTNIIYDMSLLYPLMLGATTTPQVVITQHKQIVYSGLIDDRFINLGSSRPPSINYIENTLNSLLKNERPKISSTKAVGCLIEQP